MLRNIDTDLLRAFLTVYKTGSFSVAADKLGRTQSTISQQIKKLEDFLGKPVFMRTSRSLSLTTDGEILLPYAHKIIDLNDEVFGRITQADISGNVKLGAPEAFAANHLSDVLAQFSKSHPSVGIEVHCDMSHNLVDLFDQGDLDLVLIKRDRKVKIAGNKVWREPLSWVGIEQYKDFDKSNVLPLILSPVPCVFRSTMVQALDRKHISWRAVFTSASLVGRIAAARSGLGVTAIPAEILVQHHDLVSLDDYGFLPMLKPIDIDLLYKRDGMSDAAQRLSDHIIFALENNSSLSKHGML